MAAPIHRKVDGDALCAACAPPAAPASCSVTRAAGRRRSLRLWLPACAARADNDPHVARIVWPPPEWAMIRRSWWP